MTKSSKLKGMVNHTRTCFFGERVTTRERIRIRNT